MKDTVLSISGRPGLFKLVAQGRGMLIIESIEETPKRTTAGARDRVTSLNDVAMYTDDEDVPLTSILQNIYDTLKGATTDADKKTASKKDLEDFMKMALPTYDRDRVHASDMKKLAQWYNILVKNGYTEFAEKEETQEPEKETAE